MHRPALARDRLFRTAQFLEKGRYFMSHTDRRRFLQVMGMTAVTSSLKMNIARALEIPANNRTGTIRDVEHIVILMQENRPFDHHFGTLRGVRGFSDPRAVNINLPLQSGGTAPASVFLQPAGATNEAAGYSVPADTVGGPSDGVGVIPPFRINPSSAGVKSLGAVYINGTDHGWGATHSAWNGGKYDNWANQNGPLAMSYMTREDLPYHHALADAFTVGDAYFCSIMGPTNTNRMYLWSGSVGNLSNLGPGGTDGLGAGPATSNGLSPNNAYWTFPTFPEVLDTAGVSWKIYQDLTGKTFAPDFGDGLGNGFVGNFTDNPLLYFNQYATAPTTSPLFQNGCTGTEIINSIPVAGSPVADWLAWAESQFDQFRSDVQSGKLPQVSWIIAPASYTEHADAPLNYGAWYISQVLNILVSNPEVFSKTAFIIDYDEADGSFDHIVPPTVPPTSVAGASTVSIENEIVTTSTPNGPIGLGTRVPLLVISPWSKGGYVVSQVFDHTSVIRFIEKRFGVFEPNISPWRRAVVGDLTSAFNFANPNGKNVSLPNTAGFFPSVLELSSGTPTDFTNGIDFNPTLNTLIAGVPVQEKGIRPARALPYELNVHASVDASTSTVGLTFLNTGHAAAVFQVRSGNTADLVRFYTVEPGKSLAGTWSGAPSYDLSVYGPNGFVRFFKGSIGSNAAALNVRSSYGSEDDRGAIKWRVTNVAAKPAEVTVLDAYSGESSSRLLAPNASLEDKVSLDQFHGWYDLVVTVAGDPTFGYRLAGHVETGEDSFSDPALGGLVTLKG
jgi:phospholipase C